MICELCQKSSRHLLPATEENVILWSKNMLRVAAAESTFCGSCVSQIRRIGDTLWTWREKIYCNGNGVLSGGCGVGDDGGREAEDVKPDLTRDFGFDEREWEPTEAKRVGEEKLDCFDAIGEAVGSRTGRGKPRTRQRLRTEKPKKKNSDSKNKETIGERTFVCLTCGKQFLRERSLQTHLSIHTGERPFHCEVCGKTFRQKYNLFLHSATVHSDERPYSCDTCGKRFKLKMKLEDHMKTHLRIKPHSCDTCGARFASKSDVTKHMRFHTGEKPFECSTCGKSFYTSSNLRSHEMIHTGSKPFHCSDCGKDFGRKGNLLEHCKAVHLDEKPFKCQACDATFRRQKSLCDHKENCKAGRAPRIPIGEAVVEETRPRSFLAACSSNDQRMASSMQNQLTFSSTFANFLPST